MTGPVLFAVVLLIVIVCVTAYLLDSSRDSGRVTCKSFVKGHSYRYTGMTMIGRLPVYQTKLVWVPDKWKLTVERPEGKGESTFKVSKKVGDRYHVGQQYP